MRERGGGRGFSLVELVVVTALLALLASLLLPVLAQAREAARATVCLTRGRQLALAVTLYTQDHDERLPFSFNFPAGSPEWWWTTAVHPYVCHAARENYNQGGFTGCPSATWPARLALCANPQVLLYRNGAATNPYFPGTTRALASIAAPAAAVLLAECGQVIPWENAPMNLHPIAARFHLTPPPGLSWEDLDRDAEMPAWPPADPAWGQVRYRHHGGASVTYLDGHARRVPRGGGRRQEFFPPPVTVYARMGEGG